MLQRVCLLLAGVMGAAALANGAFMLVSPLSWYLAVPGVTGTGPFNQHFIRDIGIIFLFIGAAYLIGALRPVHRFTLWSAATLWLICHAVFHLWEVAAGICHSSVLVRDFPAVSFPALLGMTLCAWAYRRPRERSNSQTTQGRP